MAKIQPLSKEELAKIASNLGAKVQVKVDANGKGAISIPFKSKEELQQLLSKIGG